MMCYLCGTKRNKVIAAALRVWRRKRPGSDSHEQAQARAGTFHKSARWGPMTDPRTWDARPARAAWTAADFEAHQRRTRYNPVRGGGRVRWE
jgi:hypothetical protein